MLVAMPLPDVQTLMLPVLRKVAAGRVATSDLVSAMAEEFRLTLEEQQELLADGRKTVFANRVHWALANLSRAALIQRAARGSYEVSDKGNRFLAQAPERMTLALLREDPDFQRLRAPGQTDALERAAPAQRLSAGDETSGTPEERIAQAVAIIEADLRERLLRRILDGSPKLFEILVLDVLQAMGYGQGMGAGEVRGGAGDGGIDGVIREDRLGLDLIYVQAKRYRPDNAIGPEKIREFAGALDFTGARKGVFITTSRFTAEAERFATQLQAKRIVLVDGLMLTSLMVEHGVGVRAKGRPIVIQDIDLDYFEPQDAV